MLILSEKYCLHIKINRFYEDFIWISNSINQINNYLSFIRKVFKIVFKLSEFTIGYCLIRTDFNKYENLFPNDDHRLFDRDQYETLKIFSKAIVYFNWRRSLQLNIRIWIRKFKRDTNVTPSNTTSFLDFIFYSLIFSVGQYLILRTKRNKKKIWTTRFISMNEENRKKRFSLKTKVSSNHHQHSTAI